MSQTGWGLWGWNLLQVPQKTIPSIEVLGNVMRTPGKHGVKAGEREQNGEVYGLKD